MIIRIFTQQLVHHQSRFLSNTGVMNIDSAAQRAAKDAVEAFERLHSSPPSPSSSVTTSSPASSSPAVPAVSSVSSHLKRKRGGALDFDERKLLAKSHLRRKLRHSSTWLATFRKIWKSWLLAVDLLWRNISMPLWLAYIITVTVMLTHLSESIRLGFIRSSPQKNEKATVPNAVHNPCHYCSPPCNSNAILTIATLMQELKLPLKRVSNAIDIVCNSLFGHTASDLIASLT